MVNDDTTTTIRRRRGNNTNDGPPVSSGAADESAGHQTSDHNTNTEGSSSGPIISLRTALTSEATRYLVRAPPAPPPPSSSTTPSTNNDERQVHKFLMRTVSGLTMLSIFILILLAGHVYVCALVFILEVLLFRELVTVRYQAYYDRIDSTIPLFRTTQWLWFSVSLFYVYSEFAVDVLIKSNVNLHDNNHIVQYVQLAPVISFSLYTTTFVLTIATLQVGHIRFQLNQLCWTIVVLCLTVGQLKYIMHNVYNGLIWFTLPILLVISNDCFAYFSGVTCGRKFIHRPFMELSPNKTWEGFIGGGMGTVVFGWYFSRFLAQYTWMTCPTNTLNFLPTKLECEIENIFHEATTYFPSQIFELFPRALIRLWPNVVEICSSSSSSSSSSVILLGSMKNTDDILDIILQPCISGATNQKHHHWELALNIIPIQLHALSLSLFASLVAPFGGFLASAIKRAYRIKDFAGLIPGHGGLMDRFDCQLIMALATWVHYNTFVKITTVSVSKLLYMYKLLGDEERKEFLDKITTTTHKFVTTTSGV